MARNPGQTERVYHLIRDSIIGSRFLPGESLREAELAAKYQVSRNTIKKVLLMLDNDGLVTVEMNKGAKVRSYSLEEVAEFLELRQVLEGFICRLAVPCFTEEGVAALFSILERMGECKDRGELAEYSQLNQEFHKRIFDTCPNHTAVEVTRTLKSQMRKYNTKTILIPSRPERSFAEHTAIARAVRDRDALAAEQAMKEHLNNVREAFLQNSSLLF